MSDQVPNEGNPRTPTVDGSNLINTGGGGSGLTSINGDTTPAQVISLTTPSSGLHLTDVGGGGHDFALDIFSGSGIPGTVPDPLASPATDVLHADASWSPGGITSALSNDQNNTGTTSIPDGVVLTPIGNYVAQKVGVAVLTFSVQMASLGGASNGVFIYIKDPGSATLAIAGSNDFTIGATPALSCSATRFCSPGNTFTFYVAQGSGAAVNASWYTNAFVVI